MHSLDKFGDLFREEQPLWVKKVVPGQVSFEIPIGPGMSEPVRVPPTGDPVCITDRADFAAVKRCGDLRKLASPRPGPNGTLRPPAIQILTEEQMLEHYRTKAVNRGWYTPEGEPDVERAAKPVYTADVSNTPPARVELPKSATEELMDQHSVDANLGREGKVQMSEVVEPRVLGICNELTAEGIAENERMPADAVLDEFEQCGELNVETLNHILAYGYYKSVKTWATKQLQARAASEDDDE